MSLSQKCLSSVQKAGQATHSAAQLIAADVQTKAQNMVASVAAQPFGADAEQAFTRFKMLARLSQGLAAVEGQLRELFAIATELANPASDVVIALPYAAKHEAANAAATDVLAKAPKAAKKSRKNAKAKRTSKSAAPSGSLTANDAILLQYLQSVLKVEEQTRLTGGAIAAGSGLPLGSIGISLKKLLASGAVTSGARGEYQLGAASASQSTMPKMKNKRAKTAKAASPKKAKSAAQAEYPAPATEVSAS